MFRFFLTKKIFAGKIRGVAAESARSGFFQQAEQQAAWQPNRRMKERFSVDHRRMTMMSDQDIMVVREVSETGFSSVVSERTWARMGIGDGYSSRVRIGPDVLEFSVKVAWKDVVNLADAAAGDRAPPTHLLGFEMIQDAENSVSGWRRLIRPSALAGSLQRVDSSFMQQFGSEKVWYHGDDGCDLMIWFSPDESKMIAWRLSYDSHYVEWRDGSPFETGRTPDLTPGVFSNEANFGSPELPEIRTPSNGTGKATIDHRRLQEALDILSASDVTEAAELIQLLEGELAHHGQNRRSNIR